MITASIVAYRTSDSELTTVLDCLRRSSVGHVYVVDNSRSHSTRELLSGDEFVTYIPSENVGYGAAHNQGIRAAMAAGADYHFVLNSDIYWADGTIEKCVEYMDMHPRTGQLMPMVRWPDGRVQLHCKLIPAPVDLLLKRFLPSFVKRRRMRRFRLEFTGYDHVMDVPYLCGCFMALRTAALEDVGLFDERFFMYPEDIDLTRRIHERWRTVFFPGAEITHIYGEASHKSLRMFWVHTINMVRYFNKWGWIFDAKRRYYNRRLLKEERYL